MDERKGNIGHTTLTRPAGKTTHKKQQITKKSYKETVINTKNAMYWREAVFFGCLFLFSYRWVELGKKGGRKRRGVGGGGGGAGRRG